MLQVAIADDDAKVRRGLKNAVQWSDLGANIAIVAGNGRDIADYILNNPIDLIISDVKMPIMTGLELSQFVYKHSPGTRLILLSAYAEFEYVQEAMSYGVKDYILKPVGIDSFTKIVQLVRNEVFEKNIWLGLNERMHSSDFRNSVYKAIKDCDDVELEKIISPLSENELKVMHFHHIREYYSFLSYMLHEQVSKLTLNFEVSQTNGNLSCSNLEEYRSFLKKQFIESRRIVLGDLKPPKGQIVKYVKNFIDGNYCQKGISTESLAEYFGVSVSYLSHAFKEAEGVTLVSYITKLRIDKAMVLLKETDLSVGHVAKTVGYENVRYFARLFKSCVNITPIEYKRSINKQ